MLERKVIEKALEEMDAPRSMTGYEYLVDIVYKISTNDYYEMYEFSDIYELVGRKYHKSGEAIYNSVRRFFEKMRNNPADFELVEKYLGFANCENSCTILRFKNQLQSQEININEIQDNERLKKLILEVLLENKSLLANVRL